MNHFRNSKKLPVCLYCLLCSVYYIWLMSMVPYAGDDWDWGLNVGLQHLLTADINSRYAGNLVVVLMTRSKLLQTILMGCVCMLTPALITLFAMNGPQEKTWKEALILMSVCTCSLFTMDRMIWRQTYGWISGFANYNVSLVFLIFYLHKVMPLFHDTVQEEHTALLPDLLLFPMAVVMQLFLENLAAYLVLASAMVCIIARVRTGTVHRKYWLLLLGNLFGLVIMFSSGIYSSLMDTGEALDGVRTLTFYPEGGPVGMLLRCFQIFMHSHVPYIWENNTVICCAISAVLLLLWKNGGRGAPVFRVINLLFILYFVFCGQFGLGKALLKEKNLLFIVETAANLGFFLLTALQAGLLYKKRPWFAAALLLMWLSAPVVIAPLSAVDIGQGRIYITSNLFLILFLAMLLRSLLPTLSEHARSGILAVCLAVTVILFAHYGNVFMEIDSCTDTRMELIEDAQQTGANALSLPAYPHSDYLWQVEPATEDRWVYFKEFFGIGPDVNVWIQAPS